MVCSERRGVVPGDSADRYSAHWGGVFWSQCQKALNLNETERSLRDKKDIIYELGKGNERGDAWEAWEKIIVKKK